MADFICYAPPNPSKAEQRRFDQGMDALGKAGHYCEVLEGQPPSEISGHKSVRLPRWFIAGETWGHKNAGKTHGALRWLKGWLEANPPIPVTAKIQALEDEEPRIVETGKFKAAEGGGQTPEERASTDPPSSPGAAGGERDRGSSKPAPESSNANEKRHDPPAAPPDEITIQPHQGEIPEGCEDFRYDSGWGVWTWVKGQPPRTRAELDARQIWIIPPEHRDWKGRRSGDRLILKRPPPPPPPPPPILVPNVPQITLTPFIDDDNRLSCRYAWVKQIDDAHPSVHAFRAFWGQTDNEDRHFVPFRSEHIHGDDLGSTVFWNRKPGVERFVAALESDAGISDWREVTIQFFEDKNKKARVLGSRIVPLATYAAVRVLHARWKMGYKVEVYKGGKWVKLPGRFVWPRSAREAATEAYFRRD